MPTVDICEPAMIRAFEKAGWTVTDNPLSIRIPDSKGYIFADVCLESKQEKQVIIVVEIKCFPDSRPKLDEFYHAIGQYLVYQSALQLNETTLPLYLAIPADIYEDFFTRTLIKHTVEKIGIKLIIVNLEQEEIVKWVI